MAPDLVEIRLAETTDASLLASAERSIAQTPGRLVSAPHELLDENFQAKIAALREIPNGIYIVASLHDECVGHALLEPMGLAAIAHVVRLTIVVHPGHEERGIGELLLRHLIAWAKSAPGVEKIELHVRAINAGAIRLYQKLGFKVEGRLRQRVKLGSDYVDELEMGLLVKSGSVLPTVVSLPIGRVQSTRREAIDDNWEAVECSIHLDPGQFTAEALAGIDSFSHVEVLFHMDQVDLRKVESAARHPRNNADWPRVGIFAQRGKNRPNQLGSTICRILRVEGLQLHLAGLDAIDGTPVLDIKPWIAEFGPRGNHRQPAWITELMRGYWSGA